MQRAILFSLTIITPFVPAHYHFFCYQGQYIIISILWIKLWKLLQIERPLLALWILRVSGKYGYSRRMGTVSYKPHHHWELISAIICWWKENDYRYLASIRNSTSRVMFHNIYSKISVLSLFHDHGGLRFNHVYCDSLSDLYLVGLLAIDKRVLHSSSELKIVNNWEYSSN